MARYEHSGDATDRTLVGDFLSGAVGGTIDSGAGWPTGSGGKKFWVAIDPDTASEEHFLANARSGTAFTLASIADRGLDGTAVQDHFSGAKVRHIWSATEADDIGKGHGAVVSHSDHTVYLVTGVSGIISWDSEISDTDGFHAPSPTPSRLTVPVGLAGRYRVSAVAEFGANAAGHRSMNIRVNGGSEFLLAAAAAGVAADGVPTLAGGRVVVLAEGDYVELRLFQNSGGNLTFNANGLSTFGIEFEGY